MKNKARIILLLFLVQNNITKPVKHNTEHNIAIPPEVVLYATSFIDCSPESIKETFITLQNLALVSKFFYYTLSSFFCANEDLQEKIQQFREFLTTDEQTQLLVTWHDSVYPYKTLSKNKIHIGTLIFNEELIENRDKYMDKKKEESGKRSPFWYAKHLCVLPYKNPVNFYVRDNQIITDNPNIKVLYLPKRKNLITYTTQELPRCRTFSPNELDLHLRFGLNHHHVFTAINTFANQNEKLQNTLLTHLLKGYTKFNKIFLLLNFPELLVNKANWEGKIPLELACENYLEPPVENENIENYAQVIRLILHHPLFDPEVLGSHGRNTYELLEDYNLTEFLENLEY